MDRLDGRVAIVTGSSSGIGEATARRLADLGAKVVINSSSSVEAGNAVAESLPTESLYVQADISDQAQGIELIERTIERFGRLDILVNNAGWTTRVLTRRPRRADRRDLPARRSRSTCSARGGSRRRRCRTCASPPMPTS